jgi:transporter family protein
MAERAYASDATMVSPALASGALLVRVLMLGYERIVTKELTQDRTSIGAAFLFFGVGTALWLPALLWTGLPGTRIILLSAGASCVYAVAFLLYVGALAKSDASIVGPLYHTAILFVMLLGFLFLDEQITAWRVVGGILLLFGASLLRRAGSPFAIIASYRRLLSDRGAAMMIVGSFALGGGRVVDGWIIRDAPVRVVLAYAVFQNLFIALWMLVVLLAMRRGRATIALARERPGRALVAGAINLTSYAFLLIAFTGLPVSIAEPASSLSMVVTVLLAWTMLHEPLKDRLAGALVMVLGAWLLFL